MRISLLATLFVLAACATSNPVRVDRADNVDLGKCRTFAWQPAATDAASLTEQRVRAAAMQTLEEKGYIQAESADCRITYLLSTREQPRSKPSIGVGAGGGSRGVGGGIGVSIPIGEKDRYVGAFTIDVIDAAAKAQIWSGTIDGSFAGPELTEDEAREVVSRVLKEFPDRT